MGKRHSLDIVNILEDDGTMINVPAPFQVPMAACLLMIIVIIFNNNFFKLLIILFNIMQYSLLLSLLCIKLTNKCANKVHLIYKNA